MYNLSSDNCDLQFLPNAALVKTNVASALKLSPLRQSCQQPRHYFFCAHLHPSMKGSLAAWGPLCPGLITYIHLCVLVSWDPSSVCDEQRILIKKPHRPRGRNSTSSCSKSGMLRIMSVSCINSSAVGVLALHLVTTITLSPINNRNEFITLIANTASHVLTRL